jgi:F-type H+-transporting ATPase subunit a
MATENPEETHFPVAEVTESEHATVETTSHEHTLYGEEVFSIGNFPVTNSMLTSWIAFLVILTLTLIIRFKRSMVPKGIQNIAEIIIEQLLNLCDTVTQNRRTSKIALPIVMAIVVFVLINNWVGILPGIGTIMVETSHGHIPLLRGATADINTTLVLAIVSVLFANLVGIFIVGGWATFTKFIRLPVLLRLKKVFKDPVQLVLVPVDLLVGFLELLGEVAKVASLSFRLFGNIFAGEVLLASMASMFAYFLPTPFLFLEFFVGIIQAFIIGLLTVVYVTLAVQTHDEGH